MSKHLKYFYFTFFILFSQFSLAENLDSLNQLLQISESDSIKIELLNTLSAVSKNDADSRLNYASRALELSKNNGTQIQIVNSYLSLSNVYQDIGDFNNSLDVLFKALSISDSIKDHELLGKTNNNLGNAYRGMGDVKKSEDFYNESIESYELSGSTQELGRTYNNLGLVYIKQEKLEDAIYAYEKSISVAKKFNDQKALANVLSNLGVAYYFKGEIDKTISYFEESLEIEKLIDNKLGVAISLSNIGELYLEKNNVNLALENLMRSIRYAKEVNAQDLLQHTYLIASQIYEKKKDYKLALDYYQYHSNLKDSLVGLEKSKYALELETRYESSEKEKKILELEKLKANQELELTEKKLTQNVLIASVLIFILLLVIFINRYNAKKKANETLSIYTSEIEEKNAEITDSIIYAKRIQAAILPPDKLIKKHLRESFVIYIPKDIVAGDFYWLEQKDDCVLFAVADCTGHGVPGAMVSVICNNALNRSVREYGLTDPGLILDKSREIVIQEFEKSDEDVSDGMDIALCSIVDNKLSYAGANNPLWVIRGNQIIEFKATKQPIGKYENSQNYLTNTIDIIENDIIYLFSDGFVDQFGGDKGKKFKTSQFKQMLLSIKHETMINQQKLILDTFNNWKGSLDQIDDVCILVVKIQNQSISS
ncbi:tetratricopeptide repeat protein [Vicingus serpentipes]|uniref:Tetratricopeptide repeat protein n=1 Tax=Vicingus serpentipes TaxID=1926625 RepID=A0A5C6RSE2_9FLAO|nr:tetratricopeptide repeat protein [Vicingus serpentipes]TXB65356.1 tetratricopeptide repeat protein [Vicingus serpentipes]